MQNVLIMMLLNSKTKTYHPIFYFEHLTSSGDVIKFKSKGHRTIGFIDRNEALKTIQSEVIDKLENSYIYQELDSDLPWDGENIPADNQFRTQYWLKTTEKLIK